MDLLLMRHGESVADIEGRHEGRADFPLTERGRRQAEALADALASLCVPDVLISSPLKRAAETAHIIAARLGSPITLDDALVEIDNGVYAGLSFEEANELYPWPEGGFKPHDAPLQGESRIAFRCRIEMFWSRLLDNVKDTSRCVGIVSHGGVIKMLYHCFLQLPVDAGVAVQTGDTGVHLWRMTGETRMVVFANRLDHLAGLSEVEFREGGAH